METGFLGSNAVLLDPAMLNTARYICVKTHRFMHHKNENGSKCGLQPYGLLSVQHSKDGSRVLVLALGNAGVGGL